MEDIPLNTPATPPIQNNLSDNITIEDTLGYIKIIVKTKKRWGWLISGILEWAIVSLCALPLVGFAAVSFLQEYLPKNTNILIWIFVGGLASYLIYAKFQEVLEYVFDNEIIEIDNISVKIEKCGWIFRKKKEYPAEKIKYIMLFSFSEKGPKILRSISTSKNIDSFWILHNYGLKRFRSFGRGIAAADARIVLEKIYTKFPQYKGETS